LNVKLDVMPISYVNVVNVFYCSFIARH
jgi:hypothetical protein